MRELQSKTNDICGWQWTRNKAVRKSLSRDVFGDEEISAVLGAKLVDGRDIRMIEACQRDRLLAEASAAGLVRKSSRRQDLDGHIAFQLLVVGEENHAHAASADLLADAVMSEGLADHRWRIGGAVQTDVKAHARTGQFDHDSGIEGCDERRREKLCTRRGCRSSNGNRVTKGCYTPATWV